MTRFVELIRVSTAGQADKDTPEIQRRALDALRRSRPGTLVQRIEVALSGALIQSKRSDIKLLEGLAGKYDELRVYAVDRLTRAADPRERFVIYGLVADSGARIVDVGGRVIDPTDDLGEVDYYLQTLFAARERKRILARTTDGRRRAASLGRMPAGKPPYARTFDKITGQWSVDAEKAKTYRRIFGLCVRGYSIRRIREDLETRGIPSPSGGKWHTSIVAILLKDRAALGEWQSLGVPIPVPPITTPQIFAEAQKRLAANRWEKCGPKVTNEVLLRKLLACGSCGSTMYVQRGGKKNGRHSYYQCSSARGRETKTETCARLHRCERVDNAVIALLKEYLAHPALPMAALKRKGKAKPQTLAEEERATLARLDAQEERLVRIATKGQVSPHIFEKQQAEIAGQRAAAKARFAAATALAEAEKQGDAADRFQAAAAAIRKRMTSAKMEDWRGLVSALFPRVPGSGLSIHPVGRIEGRGMLSLDSLEKGASKLSSSSAGIGQIAMPLSLHTYAPWRSPGRPPRVA